MRLESFKEYIAPVLVAGGTLMATGACSTPNSLNQPNQAVKIDSANRTIGSQQVKNNKPSIADCAPELLSIEVSTAQERNAREIKFKVAEDVRNRNPKAPDILNENCKPPEDVIEEGKKLVRDWQDNFNSQVSKCARLENNRLEDVKCSEVLKSCEAVNLRKLQQWEAQYETRQAACVEKEAEKY